MIGFIDVNHSPLSVTLPEFVGMQYRAVLRNADPPFETINIDPSYLQITKSESRSYTTMTANLSIDDALTLVSIKASAKIDTYLSLISVDNTLYGILNEELDLTECRHDLGTSSSSVTITATEYSQDAKGSDFTILDLIDSSLKLLSDGSIEWTYELNPLDYRYVGVGKQITFEDVVSKVTGKSLVMTPQGATLKVDAVQL